MIEAGFVGLVAVPAGLGLIGFFEPCSIGASLVFIKSLEGKDGAAKLTETVLFTLTRALVIGGLGAMAVVVGTVFADLQRGAWIALGGLYAGIGLLLATGRASPLMATLGPSLKRFAGARGSLGLGALFGLYVPACAAPLLIALLGSAAARGSSAGEGFVALGVFGLALSLPLVAAVLVPRARGLLDRMAALSGRFPLVAGLVLIALGLWSIGFAVFPGPGLTPAN